MAGCGRWVFDPNLDWDVQRRRLAVMARGVAVPRDVRRSEVRVGGVPVERIEPGAGGQNGTGSQKLTVVHFHGGGYCVGGPFVARAWGAVLARSLGAEVILPRYRLAPEHPFPAAFHDALAVLGALDERAGPVVVSGDSAGGGLALAALQRRVAAGQSVASGLVLHCPWLDLRLDLAARRPVVRQDVVLRPSWLSACARAYVGWGSPAGEAPGAWSEPSPNPAEQADVTGRAGPAEQADAMLQADIAAQSDAAVLSPLLGELGGLPPLMVQVAGDDLLRPDGEQLVRAAAAAGVDVHLNVAPGLWHDYAMQAGTLAAADRAVAAVAAAIEEWTC